MSVNSCLIQHKAVRHCEHCEIPHVNIDKDANNKHIRSFYKAQMIDKDTYTEYNCVIVILLYIDLYATYI